MVIDIVSLEMIKVGTITLECDARKVYGPEISSDIFIDQIGRKNIEYLGLLCLDNTDRIINYSTIAIGKINEITIDMAQIFKVVLLANASKFIIAHNHPSGVVTPTEQDINLTKKIGQVAQLLGVELVDSLIVSESDAFSIRSHVRKGRYDG